LNWLINFTTFIKPFSLVGESKTNVVILTGSGLKATNKIGKIFGKEFAIEEKGGLLEIAKERLREELTLGE